MKSRDIEILYRKVTGELEKYIPEHRKWPKFIATSDVTEFANLYLRDYLLSKGIDFEIKELKHLKVLGKKISDTEYTGLVLKGDTEKVYKKDSKYSPTTSEHPK